MDVKNIKNPLNFIIIQKRFISASPINNKSDIYTPEPNTEDTYNSPVRSSTKSQDNV